MNRDVSTVPTGSISTSGIMSKELFRPEVLVAATYRVLDTMDIDFDENESLGVRITVTSRRLCKLSPDELWEEFCFSLTHSAVQAQASSDLDDLRNLFATAALNLSVPGSKVAHELEEAITANTTSVAHSFLIEDLETRDDRKFDCLVTGNVEPPVLLRAVSRLHDVCRVAIKGKRLDGKLYLTVCLREGVSRTWWMEEFQSLLKASFDGGLPAVYVPEPVGRGGKA